MAGIDEAVATGEFPTTVGGLFGRSAGVGVVGPEPGACRVQIEDRRARGVFGAVVTAHALEAPAVRTLDAPGLVVRPPRVTVRTLAFAPDAHTDGTRTNLKKGINETDGFELGEWDGIGFI